MEGEAAKKRCKTLFACPRAKVRLGVKDRNRETFPRHRRGPCADFGRSFAMRFLVLVLTVLMASPAFAAQGFDGKGLSVWWALPFAGLLLCIATGPVLYHRTWEHH
ncbi:MAG: sodium:proton antiporter, partial [Rhabdaerophilum sp.]